MSIYISNGDGEWQELDVVEASITYTVLGSDGKQHAPAGTCRHCCTQAIVGPYICPHGVTIPRLIA